MARNYYQGKYKPKNPVKYMGNPDNIVFRSSWELVAFQFCDLNPAVVQWNSEEEVIMYVSPVDGRTHRYFVDLKIWMRNPDGTTSINLIEIKPYAQTIEPVKKQGKRTEAFMEEVKTYLVNQAKWKAARVRCHAEGWNFIIWTEKQLQSGATTQVSQLKSERKETHKQERAHNKKLEPKVAILKDIFKRKITAS